MKNSNPSFNPANNGTLMGTIEFALNKNAQRTDDMLPAKVVGFDRTTNRVSVQPLIAMVNTDNIIISRAQIASLPVIQIGGGGFVLSFNLVPGNLGWIKSNDRDISVFLQSYQQAAPGTNRTHSFSDAVFIPDVMMDYTISEEDAENAVLQSLDGSVKISLGIGKIKISAPIVEIDGATEVNITALTEMNVTAPLATWTGNFNVIGNITATGTITPGV